MFYASSTYLQMLPIVPSSNILNTITDYVIEVNPWKVRASAEFHLQGWISHVQDFELEDPLFHPVTQQCMLGVADG